MICYCLLRSTKLCSSSFRRSVR